MFFLQGMSNNVRFTFSVSDTNTCGLQITPSKTNRMVTLITIYCNIPLMMTSPSQFLHVHFIHNLDYMCTNMTYVQLSAQSGPTL